MEFIAYNSALLKLILIYTNGTVTLRTRGLLSPLQGRLKRQFEAFLQCMPIKVKEDKLYLSTAFPPIPSPPFSRLVHSQIRRTLGIYTPDNLTLMVTGQCQCRCEHCLAQRMNEGNELSKHELFNVIDQALELGVSQITFEGGEPTLRKDLSELIQHVDKAKATSMVVTNGQYLTKPFVRDLKKAQLDYVNVSIDSPDQKEHDQFRGIPGLFKDATDGIRNCIEAEILTSILYIARPGNCSRTNLKKMLNYCEELGAFELMIDRIVPSGRWAGREVLSEDQENEIIRFQRETTNNTHKNLITNFFELRRADFFGCFAGRRWCYISPGGEVMPCMHTPLSFGNVRKEALVKIWKRIRKHPLFNKTPKVCTYETTLYNEKYLQIPRDASLPYPINELDQK